jgi:hypothetical protein
VAKGSREILLPCASAKGQVLGIGPWSYLNPWSYLKMEPSERAVCDDLSKLTAEEQHAYYLETCEELSLDPATFPLRWIVVDGRLALAVENSGGAA